MFDSIIKLRHELHRLAELSGEEAETASRIVQFFATLAPDQIIENLGGNGLAVVFSGIKAGPTVLLRCELDALPISDQIAKDYRSSNSGVSHKCGHDGHMAILAAVGSELATRRPVRGRVVLLYQPAEENGKGAAAVVRDPKFAEIKPDFAFALHNLPGFPLGQVLIRSGIFSSASRGMAVRLFGTTAHAAQPETGLSPTAAMCRIIMQLAELPHGIGAQSENAFATVVGATLGEKAFGTAPGTAEVWATLRSENDQAMADLVASTRRIVTDAAAAHGLHAYVEFQDIFRATVNSQRAVDIVRRATEHQFLRLIDTPFRWSEDFGEFTAISEGALFGIGAGTEIPDLHNPNYDFPDELIPLATALFLRVLEACAADVETV